MSLPIVCPDLNELAQVIGPVTGLDTSKPIRSLCDNIFDVQRGELREVLESLRDAFWNDKIGPDTSILAQTTNLTQPVSPTADALTHMSSATPTDTNSINTEVERPMKRTRSEPDSDLTYQNELKQNKQKRARKSTPEIKIHYHGLNSYTSLSWMKKTLVRQIKCASAKESELLSVLNQAYRSKSMEQKRHLSLYLLPVARATRRANIVQLLLNYQ
ncbi:hypothetical protein A0J61_08466 [Choanephora cucurbitarum]|uniref:Uncharacterized protein n=1 Tax=Choanephora cucurbitarum TaxID=101091 RepID=A0A1C7N474_9FUNG|nr:hypothetical protein A0J61_08466 [Choanephora cucurbitarum]